MPSAKPPKDNKGDKGSSGQAAAKDSSSAKERLPFEPASTRKKTPKKVASTPATGNKDEGTKTPIANAKAQTTAIPEIVSRRMARRMAFFCGIPTALGMLTLIVSYLIITNHIYKLPNTAVLLVNLGFFGLGVLGLSYGALSASWDENRLGGWFGWQEFTTNATRLTESWRAAKQKPDS